MVLAPPRIKLKVPWVFSDKSSMKTFDLTQKTIDPKQILREEKGQLILEYILLLFIVVTIATILSRGLVGRTEGSTGVVVSKWNQILEMVGEDLGD